MDRPTGRREGGDVGRGCLSDRFHRLAYEETVMAGDQYGREDEQAGEYVIADDLVRHIPKK